MQQERMLSYRTHCKKQKRNIFSNFALQVLVFLLLLKGPFFSEEYERYFGNFYCTDKRTETFFKMSSCSAEERKSCRMLIFLVNYTFTKCTMYKLDNSTRKQDKTSVFVFRAMEAIYDIEVTTGSMTHAGTFDNIFITLIGTQGVSERTKLDSYGRDFKTGMVRFFKHLI